MAVEDEEASGTAIKVGKGRMRDLQRQTASCFEKSVSKCLYSRSHKSVMSADERITIATVPGMFCCRYKSPLAILSEAKHLHGSTRPT